MKKGLTILRFRKIDLGNCTDLVCREGESEFLLIFICDISLIGEREGGGGREMVARRDVGKSCLMQRKRKIFGKGGEGNWRWRRTRTIGKREHLRRLN